MKHYSLKTIADYLGAQLIGDEKHEILGLGTLTDALSTQVSFLDNAKYHGQLKNTKAGAVILAEHHLSDCPTSALVVRDPYLAYAKLAQLFSEKPKSTVGVHPTALVDDTVRLGKNVSIGPYCVIGAHTQLNDNVILGTHCILGEHCLIGANTQLAARVTLYNDISVGAHCIIHSGAIIGADGFGFAPSAEGYVKIPQLGGVSISDHVEIGANTTIDRGALNNTIIEEGVKLDNQIQVGHNVKIGAHTVIAGCTGIAGSTEIGKHCMIGGAVGFAGHIKIADHVMIIGMSMVTNSIEQAGVYASGTGLFPRADWQKMVVRLRQLNILAKKIQTLTK